jgi:bla regulator protein blaR1
MMSQLTNHLWQSTLFAVVVGVLTIAFRTNRAQIRYWLWFSASLKFLIPFSLLMAFGSQLEWAPVTKKIARQAVSSTMVQIAQPFPDNLSFVPTIHGAIDWISIILFSVWACGLGTIALIRLRGWLRIRAAVRSSVVLEFPAKIEVRVSPGLLEPGVVGLLHPILLFPAGIVERLTPRQMEAVLTHEFCHVRRRDNLTAAMHMLVGAIFWFPLVWWIGARLVVEREHACDEDVLRLGSEPHVYAEALVESRRCSYLSRLVS